jgi:hypothetical protein
MRVPFERWWMLTAGFVAIGVFLTMIGVTLAKDNVDEWNLFWAFLLLCGAAAIAAALIVYV